jgi:type I restriction enzyme R subunit
MTVPQPEQVLENNLIDQLVQLGYEKAVIRDEEDLLMNLKFQLEVHNKTTLSDGDFRQILNFISKGNIFERAKILRDPCALHQR